MTKKGAKRTTYANFVNDSASYGIGKWRGKQRTALSNHVTPCKSDPEYFTLGREYFAKCMAGQDPYLPYTCVYQDETLVIFIFSFQGVKRVHTAYRTDIQDGDYSWCRGQ